MSFVLFHRVFRLLFIPSRQTRLLVTADLSDHVDTRMVEKTTFNCAAFFSSTEMIRKRTRSLRHCALREDSRHQRKRHNAQERSSNTLGREDFAEHLTSSSVGVFTCNTCGVLDHSKIHFFYWRRAVANRRSTRLSCR